MLHSRVMWVCWLKPFSGSPPTRWVGESSSTSPLSFSSAVSRSYFSSHCLSDRGESPRV